MGVKDKPATVIPFGEWTPDTSVLSGASDIKGVISKSGRYAPLPDLVPMGSTPLNDGCIGGAGVYSSTGVPHIFLGDRARLYRVASGNPADVSKSGGYVADRDWAWTFCQFGDNIIAVARGVAPQVYQLGASSLFANLANAPLGDVVFRVRQHVFICAGRTINVSGFNDSTAWTPDPATQAFQNTIGQEAGLIVAGWGGEQGAIFQERGIVRLTYQGGAAPFIFDEVEGGRGACSPHAVVPWGRTAYVAAEDGFYVFDGMQALPIGQHKVDQWFTDRLNYAYRYKVWSAIDAGRKTWMVAFPSGGATSCNTVLLYSWADQRWSYDVLDSQFGLEIPKPGVSADDAAAITALFGTAAADSIEVSADAAIWRDSRRQWAVVNSGRYLSQFTGSNRAAVLETGVFEPNPGRKIYLSGVAPVIDAAPETMTCAIKSRLQRLDEEDLEADSSIVNEEGRAELRVEGRYMSAKIDILADADWTEATGIIPDVGAGGER